MAQRRSLSIAVVAIFFWAASPARGLSVNVLQNENLGNGGILVIELLNDDGTITDPPGYALVLDYDNPAGDWTVEVSYEGDPSAVFDPNAQLGGEPACNEVGMDCVAAQGGSFSSFTITSSISTFTLTGLLQGQFVHWHFEESTLPLPEGTVLPSGVFGVPEPGTAGLLALGIAALAIARRRR